MDTENNQKSGFVKCLRSVEHKLFGPDSPLKDPMKVFLFIKYRIQDNKRVCESERMSREYIIEQTGIWPNHFSRIIKSLEADKLIYVKRGNYRDSVATYSLHRDTFGETVISPDLPKESKHQIGACVDNFEDGVDNLTPKIDPNTKLVSEEESKHQIGVSEHQNGVETPLSTSESLTESPSKALSIKAPELEHKALEEANRDILKSYTLQGIGKKDFTRDQNISPEVARRQLALIQDLEDGRISDEEFQRLGNNKGRI